MSGGTRDNKENTVKGHRTKKRGIVDLTNKTVKLLDQQE
jgi:hypothetical protein